VAGLNRLMESEELPLLLILRSPEAQLI